MKLIANPANINVGKTNPSVAANEPKKPEDMYPVKVAVLIPTGPESAAIWKSDYQIFRR
jgi:hypothetical protein